MHAKYSRLLSSLPQRQETRHEARRQFPRFHQTKFSPPDRRTFSHRSAFRQTNITPINVHLQIAYPGVCFRFSVFACTKLTICFFVVFSIYDASFYPVPLPLGEEGRHRTAFGATLISFVRLGFMESVPLNLGNLEAENLLPLLAKHSRKTTNKTPLAGLVV